MSILLQIHINNLLECKLIPFDKEIIMRSANEVSIFASTIIRRENTATVDMTSNQQQICESTNVTVVCQ